MSFWETVVILVVALIVIRPEQLPEVAHKAGKFWARCRNHYINFEFHAKQALKSIEQEGNKTQDNQDNDKK